MLANDVVANASVLAAAGGGAVTGAAWPDIAVGLGIAALFAISALEVVRGARRELGKLAVGSTIRCEP